MLEIQERSWWTNTVTPQGIHTTGLTTMNYIEAANSTNTDVFHEGMKMGTVCELLHQLIDIGTTLTR
ncbi:hypothetical protein [Stenotrophomonas phage CM2]